MSRSNVKKRDIKELLARHYFMQTMEDYYFIFTIPFRDFFPIIDQTLDINSEEVILPLVKEYAGKNMNGYSDDQDPEDILISIFSKEGSLSEPCRIITKFFIYDIFYIADRKRKEKRL